MVVPTRHDIRGVGRCFARGVPTGECLRTGCVVHMEASVEAVHATLRRNFVKQVAMHPKCTARLMVQGMQYWYRQDAAEDVFEDTVFVASSPMDAHARRRSDAGEPPKAVPAQVCILEGEPDGTTLATWLFRHEVVDGWRCLYNLTPLLFEESVLTAERLRLKHCPKRRDVVGTIAMSAFVPLAMMRLCGLYARPRSLDTVTAQCYLHTSVSLDALKDLMHTKDLGSMSQALTCALATAYLHADPTRTYATVATNQLFDMDAPAGNHVCLKVARIYKARGGSIQDTLLAAARTLQAPGQKLADTCVTYASRAYVLGHTSKRYEEMIEARQRSLDLLVSNLPAFDSTSPKVRGVQVARDFVTWSPSIVYAIGVEQNIYLDAYFAAQGIQFDRRRFTSALASIVPLQSLHMHLPRCY